MSNRRINSQFVDGLYCGRYYLKDLGNYIPICTSLCLKVYNCQDLKPFFLTEEILVKNGWITSIGLDYNFLPYNKFCKYGMALDEYTDGVFNVDNGNLRTKITYVHELQHLLCVFDKGDVEL